MNIEKQLEFNKIKEKWIDLANTEWAKEKIKETTIFLSENELRKQLKETTDGRELIEKLGSAPLQNVDEIKDILSASEKGECLTPYQLERVEKVLIIIKRLKDYLARGKAYGNSLAYYEENLDPLTDLKEEISRQIRNGTVDDYASKELGQTRNQIAKCGENMQQKADQIIRATL